MVKGKKQDNFLSYEDILSLTNGGYDIFKWYEGRVEKKMKRPWGTDKSPSWGVHQNKIGTWVWTDLATEESGTAVEYVMRKYGLTFGQSIDKIKKDFGWGNTNVVVKPRVLKEVPEEEKVYAHISFTTRIFEPHHHEYWNKAGVQEADCKKMNCWALRDIAVNRKRFPLRRNEVAFAFYAPEEDKVKLYFPERPKENRFLNNVSYYYLWNFSNVGECEDLIVQKSPKDMIVTSVLTPCVTATQAEAVKIFTPEIVAKINKVAKNVWVFYGSDPDGVKKCKEITSKFNYKYINTPKKYLPDINDVYGMACKDGLKAVEDFMKSKKFPI